MSWIQVSEIKGQTEGSNARKNYTAVFSPSPSMFPGTSGNLSIEASALCLILTRIGVGRCQPGIDGETGAGIKLISLARGIDGM